MNAFPSSYQQMEVALLISLPRFILLKTITMDLKLEIALHSAPSFYFIIRCSAQRHALAPLTAHLSPAAPPCVFFLTPPPSSSLFYTNSLILSLDSQDLPL